MVLTLLVIGILIMSSPTQAVEITLSAPMVDGEALSGDATLGDVITFNATVDVNDAENIPIQNVSIKVSDTLECFFDIDGTYLAGGALCSGFTVTLNSSDYTYTNATYGYGFGVDENGTESTKNTTFNSGYSGYGYASNPILHYVIEWDTEDFDADDYSILFYVNAASGATSFKYGTEDPLEVTLDRRRSGGGSNNGSNDDDDSAYVPPPMVPSASYGFTDLNKGTKVINVANNQLPLTTLIVTTVADLKGVTFKIALKENPTVPKTDKVYKYFEIDHVNVPDAAVSGAKLQFTVPKSWLTENKLEKSQVALYRYTTSWNLLNTYVLREDANNVYYEASSPGLSTFAIGTKPQPPVTVVEEIQETPTEEITPAPTANVISNEQPEKSGKLSPTLVAILIIVVLAALLYLFYTIRRYK